MKKSLLILSVFLSAALNGNSQTWEKLFSNISTDVFRCVIEVPAGGYIAAGYTSDSTVSDTDAYVVRMNTSGDTLWTFRYNGPLSKKDLFYKVINTIDGGFALCGYTSSVTGLSDDVLYLKLNSSGQQQWVKFYGGSGKERAQDILQTSDGKYTIVGYTTTSPAQYYDAFMLRTNSTGDTLWTKRYGASNYDDANSVQLLFDGGYIMGGQSNNGANGLDQYLIRTNSTGDTLWTKRFGTLQTDNIECIRSIPGGFIIAGSTNTLTTGDDGNIVKTDTFGTVLWSKSYGGIEQDDFHRIEPTTGGGFVASGTTSSSGPLDDNGNPAPNMWLLRINSVGDTLWSKTFGGASHDHGYSAQQTSDGGYIIAGHTGSFQNAEEAYVIKTDGSGVVTSGNHLTYTLVYDILTPNSTTCGGPNTPISIRIKNRGNQSVANYPVTLEITGAQTLTIPQTFGSNSSDTVVTFTTTINTSAGGTFTFNCYTNNGNDVVPARNSITKTFTINVTAPNPTVTGNSRCGNGTVNLSASGSGTLYWFTNSTGGSSINTGTTYNTPTLTTTTTYYVQANLTCPSARIPVIATVHPISPDPVTTGASRCGSGVLTLTATNPDSITWYDAPTGGNVVDTGISFTTPSLTTTTNYYAQASNGFCPSNRVIAVAMVSSVAADPVTTSTQRCGPGSDTLVATSPDPVLWYDALSGGTQVGSGLTFITPSLTNTTTYYAEADNGCVSNRVAATVTINPLAADPVTTSDQNCGPGSLSLSATAVDPIVWYSSASGGVQVGVGSPFITPTISTTTTYYALAFNGTCPSNPIAATAVILTLPVVNLGNDTAVNALSFLIDAGPGFASYLWSNGATTQSITITGPDTSCVTVTDANGCNNSDCIFVDLYNAVSTIQSNHSFTIYPNPAGEKITIDFNSSISNPEIDILNLTGELITNTRIANSDNVTFDLSSFAKGIYFVRIKSGSYLEMQKLIIQ